MITKSGYEELSKFRDTSLQVDKENLQISKLISAGLIAPDETAYLDRSTRGLFYIDVIPKTWKLTPAGQDALSEFENNSRQNAKQKPQKYRDRAFEIFLVFFAFILTICAPYIIAFVQWLYTLLVK